jgi:hypothetical protein
MIRRLRPATKTETATPEEQSETDTQSLSEDANTAPQAGPQKRKARVCTHKDCQRLSSKLLR